jgi:hypothetical protein
LSIRPSRMHLKKCTLFYCRVNMTVSLWRNKVSRDTGILLLFLKLTFQYLDKHKYFLLNENTS